MILLNVVKNILGRRGSRGAGFHAEAPPAMQQTPVHEQHNPDLLNMIPKNAARLIEVGCSSGALAREYKKNNHNCHYVGVEISPIYAELAERHCDTVLSLDIESAVDDEFFRSLNADVWIFGDILEHLRDPWSLLRKIRKVIPDEGCVVACIPNAQHWSIQARLSCGNFRYEDSGLLDRTHLRWFTRQTIVEMFEMTGFQVIDGSPRIFNEPARENFLPSIRGMALAMGADPNIAEQDALPLQYVVKATPKRMAFG